MHLMGRPSPGSRLLRPVARAADGIVHNRERRKRIHRYRRVARVALATEHDDQQSRSMMRLKARCLTLGTRGDIRV